MKREPLDLQKIRRNWERAGADVRPPAPDRFQDVAAPLDAYHSGRLLLERLRREVGETFPEHQKALAPFLTRAEVSFAQLRERVSPEAADEAKDAAALREQLAAALCDLEDICEAFLGLKP